MERFRGRLLAGGLLMAVGFGAELVMLSGLLLPQRPPAWFWGLLLLIGAGAAVLVAAFVGAARDRRRRTVEALGHSGRG